jgi:hypothetical protein
MLDPNLDDMRKEIDAFAIRLPTLKEHLQEGHRFSVAETTSVERIEQHNELLAARLSSAERSGTWDSIRAAFSADSNSLIVDLEMLEERLYELLMQSG